MCREEGRKGRTDWRYVRRIVRGFVQDRAEKTRRQASAREVLLDIKRVCRSDKDRIGNRIRIGSERGKRASEKGRIHDRNLRPLKTGRSPLAVRGFPNQGDFS